MGWPHHGREGGRRWRPVVLDGLRDGLRMKRLGQVRLSKSRLRFHLEELSSASALTLPLGHEETGP